MLAAIRSAALIGIDAYDVIVEVDAAPGLPQWTLVGLPLGAVKESRERVGAALVNSGFTIPPRRVTINLAPADVRKDGTAFDLPIALGFLVATGQLEPDAVDGRIYAGELGLDGQIRPIRGALSIAMRAASTNVREIVIPFSNLREASHVSAVQVAAPPTLAHLVDELARRALTHSAATFTENAGSRDHPDFSDVAGQAVAKRALEIAAAGGHNVLMIGPPGAGKTMLARRLPGILPRMSEREALDVIAIHSVAGTLTPEAIESRARPFRAPHHSISSAGLIGGGSSPRPGEVSLAHHGVLFLDEMLEFPRYVLDGLRQPMEDGRVVLSRAMMSVCYPARFTLIGATNPCPCGRIGDPGGSCSCSPADVERYSRRLSGPLADRIDMHVNVRAVALRDLSSDATGESSDSVRLRVCTARSRQTERFARVPGVTCNADASGSWIDRNGSIMTDARELLNTAATSLSLSARGFHRVLKVARTIADIDESPVVSCEHVAEALRYRSPAIAQ